MKIICISADHKKHRCRFTPPQRHLSFFLFDFIFSCCLYKSHNLINGFPRCYQSLKQLIFLLLFYLFLNLFCFYDAVPLNRTLLYESPVPHTPVALPKMCFPVFFRLAIMHPPNNFSSFYHILSTLKR